MITESYIMKRLQEYASTKQGKAAIKEKYGIDYDDKANKALLKYGQLMKEILYKHTHDVIKSISLDDIIVGSIITEGDKPAIKISFRDGSLKRESLRPDLYPDGLENIVLLFAHGYSAKNPVRGQWKNSKSYPNTITGRQQRDPDDFLKKAVEEFNSMGNGIAKAVLETIYQ